MEDEKTTIEFSTNGRSTGLPGLASADMEGVDDE